MSQKPVHLYTHKPASSRNVFYLLIPSIVFALILTLYFYYFRQKTSDAKDETIEQIQILGEEATTTTHKPKN